MAVAPRITRVILNDERVISTSSIKVFGLIIGNRHATDTFTVTFLDNDDNTLLTTRLQIDTTVVIDCEWIADNGLKIGDLTDVNVAVTVLFGLEGA